MPIFKLSEDLVFPHPSRANKDGILAVGGDLSPQRLLLAYNNGIFPWFNEGDPIIWWSPNPRFVLFPQNIRISTSMKKVIKRGEYTVTLDEVFPDVIKACGNLRTDGTWITDSMVESYCKLHELGFAHSVETWYEGRLVGGLYGVSLGRCFFGESMFSTRANASKAALIYLAEKLLDREFLLIDCQVYTKHLESMGAENVSRNRFLELLSKGLEAETLRGAWGSI
jgi:leucyl/phenylalanyl-tRNA---protein transferase